MSSYLHPAITPAPYDGFFGSKFPTLERKKDIISEVPLELSWMIFSYLDLTSLGASRQVCRTWGKRAEDPKLWKSVIYREIAFSNKDWARCFGEHVVAHEKPGEDWDTLPWQEYIEDSRKFHNLFPEKSGKDHLMLVRLPEKITILNKKNQPVVTDLTINRLGLLARQYFPNNRTGYRFILEEIVYTLGNFSTDKSCWMLMTRAPLKGSRAQSYSKQEEMVADLAKQSLTGYEVPGILEAATCILSQYFSDSKTRLYSDDPWTNTRCKDSALSCQTVVGGFTSAGLVLHNSKFDLVDYGVAALRKF